jgi:transcriptional regulator with XRE-family HTH domain
VLIDNSYQKSLEKIGNNLRSIRLSKGLTMRDVAERCGMEENNYGRFERAQTNPTIKSLLNICEVLEIDIKDLF